MTQYLYKEAHFNNGFWFNNSISISAIYIINRSRSVGTADVFGVAININTVSLHMLQIFIKYLFVTRQFYSN
jgi:hypothetical protein